MERLMSENWRERRGLKESGETTGAERSISGNWRVCRQEVAKPADVSGEYGGEIPAEWKLQQMYKQLKIDNNQFTTWLVESIYPSTESLPSYITLSRKQAKDYAKYDILVNNMADLARQTQRVPLTMLTLLDRLIAERTEYSHWMSRKLTEDISKSTHESHAYYIQVLKEARVILAERVEPASSRTRPSTLPTPAQKLQHSSWRQIITDSCDKTSRETHSAVTGPMRDVAAARVAITA